MRSPLLIILKKESKKDIFFNFTASPREGYCTLNLESKVMVEVVTGKFGLSARNVKVWSQDVID